MKQRNGAVELLRFVFTFLVIAAHYKSKYGNDLLSVGMNGHISVEFFFLLSGFLMAADARKQRELSESIDYGGATWGFLKRKAVRMAPVYYAALFICMFHWWQVHPKGVSASVLQPADFLARSLPSLLFIPFVGMEEIVHIPYSWYIGEMMLGMLLLYPLLLRFGKNFSLLAAPIITVFYCCYAMQTHGSLTMIYNEWLMFFWPAFLRALAGLSGGCICYELCEQLKKRYAGRIMPAGCALLTAAAVGLSALSVIWIALRFTSTSQLFAYPMFGAILIILFSQLDHTAKWLGDTLLGRFAGILGRLSLPCYLGQGIVMYYYPVSLIGGGISALFAMVSFVCSWA